MANARQASMLLQLAVVMAGALLFKRVDSCLRNAPPVDQWDGRLSDLRINANRGEINTLTAVMSDYIFYCNGTISQWRLQWYIRTESYEECTVTFTFYVLRPDSGNECILTRVGSNTVTTRIDDTMGFSLDEERESIFNVSVEDRITVKAGDIVGLRVQSDRDCDDMRLWIIGIRSTDNNIYRERHEDDDTSLLPNDINICSFHERERESPYITAVAEPITEATPTTVYPTETSIQEGVKSSKKATLFTVTPVTTVTMYQPQPNGSIRTTRRVDFGGGRPAMAGTDGSGGNMTILASVGASVGVLLVIAAALTAVLCLWQCSRRRLSKSAPENSPQFNIGENEAYGAHTQHPPQEQVRNGGGAVSGVAAKKLPQKTQFLMEENEAYKVHTHQPQGTDRNGYYDTVECKEEEEKDYVVGEPVYYEVPT